jgi:hypothetical protein
VRERCDERLCPRIDAQPLPPEREGAAAPQRSLVDHQHQAGIAALHGVAHPVALGGVEEQHLVRIGDRAVAPDMPHIGAAIGKDELGDACLLLRPLVPAGPGASHVPHGHERRGEQGVNGKLGHVGDYRRKTPPVGPAAPSLLTQRCPQS